MTNCLLFKEVNPRTNLVYNYWKGMTIHHQKLERVSNHTTGSTTDSSHWSWEPNVQTLQLRSHHVMETVHWRIQSQSPLHQRYWQYSCRCSVSFRDSTTQSNGITTTLDIPVSLEPKKPLVNTFGGQRWEIKSQTLCPSAPLVNRTNADLQSSMDTYLKRKPKQYLGIKCALTSSDHTQFAEKARRTSSANLSPWSILPPVGSRSINMMTNEQSPSLTSPKRNGFPDTLGQLKSLMTEVLNSLDMNFRRC